MGMPCLGHGLDHSWSHGKTRNSENKQLVWHCTKVLYYGINFGYTSTVVPSISDQDRVILDSELYLYNFVLLHDLRYVSVLKQKLTINYPYYMMIFRFNLTSSTS